MTKPSTMLTALLMLAGAVSAAGQQPPLQLSGLKWARPISYISDPRFNANKSGRDQDDYPGPSGRPIEGTYLGGNRYEVLVRARNTATKKVVAVSIEVVFFKDEQRTEMLSSVTFRQRQVLAPGEAKELRRETYGAPRSRYMEAQVVLVEYADGSWWKVPGGGVLDLTKG